MRFFLGRTEVRITAGAVLLVLFCIVADEWKTLLIALVSLAVHEAAHAVAARNLHIPAARVTVYPFGAVMQLASSFADRRGEGIVAAAGPAASLSFAALLRLCDMFLPAGDWTQRLVGTNLLIALFNLLPAFPLDGGRIVRAALHSVVRERTARALLFAFTGAIAFGMIGVGVYCVLKGYPAWTLFFVPPFLAVSAFREWRIPDTGIVTRVMERRRAVRSGIAQKAQIIVLSEDTRIGDAVSALSGTRFTIVRVRTDTGFTELDEDTLLDAAAAYGMQTTLKTAISRLTDRK